jgi:hypothetical protein
MSTGNKLTFYSVTKFVSKFQETTNIYVDRSDMSSKVGSVESRGRNEYPDEIKILFNPKESTSNKTYNQTNIKVLGVIFGNTALTYPTLVKSFGPNPIISFNEKGDHVINKTKPSQLLMISIEPNSFFSNTGENITYHPIRIIDTPPSSMKNATALMKAHANNTIKQENNDIGEVEFV